MVGALKNRHYETRVSISQEGELGVLAYHLNLLAAMLEEHRSLQMKYTEELITSRGCRPPMPIRPRANSSP
jgi:F0F1-type ATP synthase epsilon subunit